MFIESLNQSSKNPSNHPPPSSLLSSGKKGDSEVSPDSNIPPMLGPLTGPVDVSVGVGVCSPEVSPPKPPKKGNGKNPLTS
jgi:hypothetical protein